MYGYIYKTTNLINQKVYIGKKKSTTYIPSYLGSGKLISDDVKLYGKNNFTNEILDVAFSLEELNKKEKHYIQLYKNELGDKCYNIAKGGDGGDTTTLLPPEDRVKFIDKMTRINKERCSSEDFKKKMSEYSTARWRDEEYRQNTIAKIKEAQSNEELKQRQRERMKERWKDESYSKKMLEHSLKRWEPEDARDIFKERMNEVWTEEKRAEQSKIIKNATTDETRKKKSESSKKRWENEEYKKSMSEKIRNVRLTEDINKGAEARKTKVLMCFNGEEILFNSRVEFENYCIETFGFAFSNKTYKKLLNSGEPFKSYYKKQAHMNGIRLYSV